MPQCVVVYSVRNVCWQHISDSHLTLNFHITDCPREETAMILFCWRTNWDWLATARSVSHHCWGGTITYNFIIPTLMRVCHDAGRPVVLSLSRKTQWFFCRSACCISPSRAFASVTLLRTLRLLIKRTPFLCIFFWESILLWSVGSESSALSGPVRPGSENL